eukprot:PITA_19488
MNTQETEVPKEASPFKASPSIKSEKKQCWDSIKSLADLENLENIIIVGDLNLTLLASEKRGGSIVRNPAREWAEDLMQDWDLLDIKPVIGTFTWSNKRVGPRHIAARLDRFLVQSSFLLLGLEARMRILHSSVSNHKPISLELISMKDLGPIPFRFSSLRTKEIDFLQRIKDCWKEPVKDSPFFVWEEKLRRVKMMLKGWAQARKCRNSISEIKNDNRTIKDFSSIKRATSNHFEKMYTEDVETSLNANLIDVVPKLITAKMNQILEDKITINEVKEALFAMEPDKAPGPDGFTPRFLQTCWQIVEKEFMKMIQKSQKCQKIGGCTNSAFLALIPKEKGAKSFNRFRPISLCNIGYKVITKVIANRLKKILPKVIPGNQGGFI